MTPALVVARKELRALFQSPVALLFLGIHQLVVLFVFFSSARFFARNLADIRPLFAWLPLLLIFLTAALTMRAWAEERKLGTLEVLMTLPVRTWDLVLGKFIAATALVGIALLLTLPLPIMVSILGPLDWGPVIGGYAGALLLGALYSALGLTVSSRTDNQVVSLMLTLSLGAALYLIGSDVITSLVATDTAQVMRGMGTGSRFLSLERGVLDLRDFVYYGALTTLLLFLNHSFLERERLDPGSASGGRKVRQLGLVVGLVAANAIAAVVWTTPITQARLDLTERGEYSISPATKGVLKALDEPLYLEGYFSERTHPKLAALVPQLRDLITEFGIAGGDLVRVSFADPNADPDLEAELAERYSLRAIPFQVDDRNQLSVVNSFFHVLVKQGDEHALLGFNDLIEVTMTSGEGLDVRLRNPEYDLTRTIKRVSQDFQPLSAVLRDLPSTAKLTFYVSEASLPEAWAGSLEVVRQVGERLSSIGGDRVQFEERDPSQDPSEQESIYQRYGVRPMAADLLSRQIFWFDLVITMDEEVERVSFRGEVSTSDVEKTLESALRRLVPGQFTTVALLTERPEAPPPNPQIPPQFQPPPPQPDYRALEQLLGRTHPIERWELDDTDPHIPSRFDVVVVAKPGDLSAPERFALDQYLMRGGRVIALAGRRQISASQQGLSASAAPPGLTDLLEAYGVTVEDAFVLDKRAASFPRPVRERRGGIVLERVELAPYPFFPDVRRDGMAHAHPSLAGVDSLTFPWASPLKIDPPDGVEATVLAHTTSQAWTSTGLSLDPLSPTGSTGQHTLAVALSGVFPSAFQGQPDPTRPGADADGPRTVIDQSLPDARLAVVGSSEIVSDILMSLAQQPGGEVHAGNLAFLGNLIDWAVEDEELLAIRGTGAFARTLAPLTDAERQLWETTQYVLAILLLGLVAWWGRARPPRELPLLASEVS